MSIDRCKIKTNVHYMQANEELKTANDNSKTKIRRRRKEEETRLTKRVFFPVNVYFWKWFVSLFLGDNNRCVRTSRLWNKWKWMIPSPAQHTHSAHSANRNSCTHWMFCIYALHMKWMTKLMVFFVWSFFSIFTTIYWNCVGKRPKESNKKILIFWAHLYT